ncbi:DUF3572 family protein [Novosphingobium sp. FKTRR1]|uniref:DUF3572 family protein n=1 Tax=unclassified Novosphingobium TaxID=2644732 RepID=UPI001CEFE361|nr:DUF3572 family protein [Novosphingobium sp. FKTRR1]
MTIIREPSRSRQTGGQADGAAIALQALGWVLSDDSRAERFLSLTGLTPDTLRAGLQDGALLGAVIDFLSNHEADLVAAADALDIGPQAILAARNTLS